MKLQRQPDSSSTLDVHELHRRCCSREPHVANAAFQQLGQYLLRIAYRQISSQPHLAHIAEDSSQQALVTIWKKLSDGNGPDHVEWFLTWCASIVIHKVLDELRKLSKSRTDSLEEHLDNHPVPPPQLHTSHASAPDVVAMEVEDRTHFVNLILNHPRLSAEAKIVLLRGYLLELDDEELAQQLGKSRSTIRVIRHRGLQLLRDDQEFMRSISALALAGHV
jgi:RNA polymerase sigma factor (sigma-70 family)